VLTLFVVPAMYMFLARKEKRVEFEELMGEKKEGLAITGG